MIDISVVMAACLLTALMIVLMTRWLGFDQREENIAVGSATIVIIVVSLVCILFQS